MKGFGGMKDNFRLFILGLLMFIGIFAGTSIESNAEGYSEIGAGVGWSSHISVYSEADLIEEFSYAETMGLLNGGWYEKVKVENDIYLSQIITVNAACIWLDLQGHTITVGENGGFKSNAELAISDSCGNGKIVYCGNGCCLCACNSEGDNCISLYSGTIEGKNREGILVYGEGKNSVVNIYGGQLTNAKYGVYINGSRVGRSIGGTITDCHIGYGYYGLPDQSAINNAYYSHNIECHGVVGGTISECDVGVEFQDALFVEMMIQAARIHNCGKGVNISFSNVRMAGDVTDCETGIYIFEGSSYFEGNLISGCKKGVYVSLDSVCHTDIDYYHNTESRTRIMDCETGIYSYGTVDCNNTNIICNREGIHSLGTAYIKDSYIKGERSINHSGIYCGIGGAFLVEEDSPVYIAAGRMLTVENQLTKENLCVLLDLDDLNKRVGYKAVEFAIGETGEAIDGLKFKLLHQNEETPIFNYDGSDFSGIKNSAVLHIGASDDLGINRNRNNGLYYTALYSITYKDNSENKIEGLHISFRAEGRDYESGEYCIGGYYGEKTIVDLSEITERFEYDVDEDVTIEAGFINFIGWTEDSAWYAKKAIDAMLLQGEINTAYEYVCYSDMLETCLEDNIILYGAYQASDEIQVEYYENNDTNHCVIERLTDNIDEDGYYHFMDKPTEFSKEYTKDVFDVNSNSYRTKDVNCTFVGWSYYKDSDIQKITGNKDDFISYSNDLYIPCDEERGKVYSTDFVSEVLKSPNISLSKDGMISLKLYAVWDEEPVIKARDMYICPYEIETLTEESIIDQMKAEIIDREDDKNGLETELSLDLKSSDVEVLKRELKNVGEIGGVSVTFKGTDSRYDKYPESSKPVFYTGMIYVASDKELSKRSLVRFIDRENYEKKDEKDGALMAKSIWYFQDEKKAKSSTGEYNPALDYKATLGNAFDNLDKLSSGDDSAAIFSLDMNIDSIKASKKYVAQYGYGTFGANQENENPLLGWIGMMSSNGSVINDKIRNLSNKDIELYTVNYYPDVPQGCSSELKGVMETDYLRKNECIKKNTYSLEGYVFKGWRITPSEISVSSKVYSDNQSLYRIPVVYGTTINLYAVWEPIKYTIKLNAGNGLQKNEPVIIEAVYDQPVKFPSVNDYFEGQDYEVEFVSTDGVLQGDTLLRCKTSFNGWALEENDVPLYQDEDIAFNLTSIKCEVNLYAVWSTGIIETPKAEKEGYIFEGWWMEDGTYIGMDAFSITPTQNLKVYAGFRPIKYSFVFNNNLPYGIVNEVEKISCQEFCFDCPSELTKEIPELEGYTFKGWTLNPVEGKCDYKPGDVVFNATIKDEDKITLYALWEGNEYEIKFFEDRSNVENECIYKMTAKYGEINIIPKELEQLYLKNEGTLFKYWEDEFGRIYSPEQVISNLTTDGEIKLYAVWENMNLFTKNFSDTLYNPPESILEPSTEECQTDQQPEPQLHHSEE